MRCACRKERKLLVVLAIALLGCVLVWPGQTSAAGEIELYTAYTDLSAPPGESITYAIEVMNQSKSIQETALSVRTNGNDWNYELTAGGHPIRQIAVKPSESQTVNLQLDVPLEVNKGDYIFDVLAAGEVALTLKVGVSEQGTFTTEFTAEQANMQGHADSSFKYSTTIRNRTSEEQTYSLTAAAEPGWDVRFSSGGNNVTSVTVEPNGTETVSVDVAPPEKVEAGTYTIPIMAANNATSAETKLEAVITGTYDIKLATADERLNAEVTAGSSRKMDLVVTNTGTTELQDVRLTAQAPVNWEVTFEPSSIRSLAPGQTTNVQATIKSDNKALAGDYVVSMSASSTQKSSDAAIRVAVKSSVLWGWIGVLIIAAVAAAIYYLFRKYGRR